MPAAVAGEVLRALMRDLTARVRADGGEVSPAVRQLLYALHAADEQHAHQSDVTEVEAPEAVDDRRGALANADLDDIDTRLRHAPHRDRRRLGVVDRVADGGTDRNVAGHADADGRDSSVRQLPESPSQRVLGVDDVGPERRDELRLALVRHAGEHPRHLAHVFHISG